MVEKTACVTLKKITPAVFEEAIRLSSTNNRRLSISNSRFGSHPLNSLVFKI